LVERLLSTAALWVRNQTSPKNTKTGDIPVSKGVGTGSQHPLARRKNTQKIELLLVFLLVESVYRAGTCLLYHQKGKANPLKKICQLKCCFIIIFRTRSYALTVVNFFVFQEN
jgi:hypothetical protein